MQLYFHYPYDLMTQNLLLTLHLNIILQSTSISSKDFFFSGFPIKIYCVFHSSDRLNACPEHLILLDFIILTRV
jgi:hypothetical protein